MIDFDKLLENEAFRNIDPEKIQAAKEISSQLEGKNSAESMKIITSYAKIFNQGKPISPEERKLMLSVLLDSMDEKQKQSYSAMFKLMGIY